MVLKPFHMIAVPHDDIIKNNLEMAVFAADLWDTYKNRSPDVYTDEKTFFKKTHITKSLQNVLDDIQNRIQGKGSDKFQHIETPFGGGKTHAMIAMYHNAKKLGCKPVVIVGTSMSKDDTIWGMIEEQLDGKIDKLSGNLAPGREKIRNVLKMHEPIIILIDELLQYIAVAAGVKIVNTNLATQSIIFIQQLAEAVASLDRVCVVASFPASTLEISDKKKAEELLMKLRKVSGRSDRKITPVSPEDIPNIIRSRLFSATDSEIKKGAEEIISHFVEYCERESILPPKISAVEYRKKFEKTYPFLPEVIDILYQNWGTFSSFQRTRGVLRLLSMVLYSMKDSQRPYITLADFDLNNNELRRELLTHIGDKFDSVLTKDITNENSGAVRVEKDVGHAYRGLHLGTRAATAIFMYSFSSEGKNGAAMNQIKMAVADIGNPSSIVSDVVDEFRRKLSYFKTENGRNLFSSDPNINRLKLDKMDNIKKDKVAEEEKSMLTSNIGSANLRVSIWPSSSKDVEDSPTLKLVIMHSDSEIERNDILANKGNAPRIYRNSIFFLCASNTEKTEFVDYVKNRIALGELLQDLNNPDQKKQVEDELRKAKSCMGLIIKKYYRTLHVPTSNGYETYDMGVPMVDESSGISSNVFKRLVDELQVHEKIGPRVLKEYIGDDKFAHTLPMYGNMLKTRGERRPTNQNVLEKSISDGVEQGTFGLGEMVEDGPSCISFKRSVTISFVENEIIMDPSLCKLDESSSKSNNDTDSGDNRPNEVVKPDTNIPEENKELLDIELDVPVGRMNDVWGILRLINLRFKSIRLNVHATDGQISNNEMKQVNETLKELGANSDI